ncbi:hypothetical protein D7Z54_26230 [Salibacterium salarium]|uniref:Sporulation lipoprotein YhcN/YlaJ (Spore_YhcN_YlaJ) n=1 Tax=Salibacterium salarium TaxID=284579 RepID=A0A3R9QH07_9BACI|nr:YhcN/YlaJ family sporulation lipoprotein [Salibacterium salarium]RSL30342.1 hypothetical protein D7Z54_26230 [Salibacterium salarium]
MKNTALIIVIALLLQGCAGMTNTDKEDLGAEYGPEHALDYISNDKQGEPNRNDGNRFGYGRSVFNDVDADEDMSMHDLIDRQRIAEGLSNLLVRSPEVEEAGVLITNEYALTAFKTDMEDTQKAAKHVKMMVEAAVPYFFITVVTDNETMMEDIEAFKGMPARSSEGRQALEKTIENMRDMTKQPVTPKEKADSYSM